MDKKKALYSLIRPLPKAELHVHLEGATKFETVFELAEKNGVRLPYRTPEQLRCACSFQSFADFSRIYEVITSAIRCPDDFSRLVTEFSDRMNAENIVYSEVTWTPQLHVTDAHPFEAWLEAANSARASAEERYGVEIRWVLDILRDQPEGRFDVVEWATSSTAREGGVVALGLGGTEERFPPDLFVDAFSLARDRGIHAVPHAGEHEGARSGPQSILTAVDELHADRVGHGNRAAEDDRLMKELAARGVPLEICPTSNVKLGIYPSLNEHPLPKLLAAGCVVTLNTDDPEIFGTTLTDEYVSAIERMRCSFREVKALIENGFLAALDREAAIAAQESRDSTATFSIRQLGKRNESDHLTF